ncbi:hypothetical protein [Thermoflexibacter ruber]|uniref:Uncharacterized protein n=1 Tax=Thermoflexibacter ruber TaxID=1003 RepID=A0A1I2FSJ9_9BACT|nr:hypothetical protein [Thermoflexibacter ruber]SFF07778.1 hypothetical protein SAMN04488541_10159 [Thermoflexibacter ruber]
MSDLEYFIGLLQKEVPVRIKYKDESWEMRLLYFFIKWFNPHFMTDFTTVIGYTVYFTNRKFIEQCPKQAMQILAHEAVHLLDTKRFSFPIFALAYLFPQVLIVFALLFPINAFYIFFLFFALPLPAPFRAYFEARAYSLDIILGKRSIESVIKYFISWDYYKMFPFKEKIVSVLEKYSKYPSQEMKYIMDLYQKAEPRV